MNREEKEIDSLLQLAFCNSGLTRIDMLEKVQLLIDIQIEEMEQQMEVAW